MPIYTYSCNKCGITSDYLVGKAGSLPEKGCKSCRSYDLTKILMGQTFGVVNTTEMTSQEIKPVEHNSEKMNKGERLEQGVYITTGIAPNGKLAVNMSRVQADGHIDASVTGYK